MLLLPSPTRACQKYVYTLTHTMKIEEGVHDELQLLIFSETYVSNFLKCFLS